MNLADKLCKPLLIQTKAYSMVDGILTEFHTQGEGLNFREALVLALASNPAMVDAGNMGGSFLLTAKNICHQADAIIEEMER